MTGQGQAQGCSANAIIDVETRAVNNRFLKVTAKVSSQLGGFDSAVEGIVRESVRRGTVQVNVTVAGLTRPETYQLNSVAIKSYWSQACKIAEEIGASRPLFDSLLQLPGVLSDPAREDEDPELVALAAQTLKDALVSMNQMRRQEGEAMVTELKANINKIELYSSSVAERAPEVVADYKARLETRMKQAFEGLDISLDASAILREAQIFADRSDIREELVRLASHLNLFRKAMDDSESQGRKLDFLVQEIGREINTIGSKANDSVITEQVVMMKTTLEQIRELIQNVE